MVETVQAIVHHPLGLFSVLTLGGFGFYLALSAASYLVFFVWGKERFNPDHVPDPASDRRAVAWALFSVAGNAALMTPLHLLALSGWGKVYWDVGEHGWGWLLVSVALLLVVSETLVYWIHRALHTKWLFKHLHVHHHRWREPTPWTSVAFHPLDSFAQALPHHLCAFLFPLHGVVYLVAVAMVTVWSVAIHDRVSLVRWGWLNYTGHHSVHHFYNNWNFGQYTTFWDRWCGTYRAPVGERFLRPARPGRVDQPSQQVASRP